MADKTLNDLVVGDTAYILVNVTARGPRRWYEVTVTRVTPTQLVVKALSQSHPKRFRKANGREIPDDGPWTLLRATSPAGQEGYEKSNIQLRNERHRDAAKFGETN